MHQTWTVLLEGSHSLLVDVHKPVEGVMPTLARANFSFLAAVCYLELSAPRGVRLNNGSAEANTAQRALDLHTVVLTRTQRHSSTTPAPPGREEGVDEAV